MSRHEPRIVRLPGGGIGLNTNPGEPNKIAPLEWIDTLTGSIDPPNPASIRAAATLIVGDDTAPAVLRELCLAYLKPVNVYRVDRPRARRTDPETSQEAADKVKARGPARPGGVVHRILAKLTVHGPLTARELTEGGSGEEWPRGGISGAWRRTSELLDDGLVAVVRNLSDGCDAIRDGGRVLAITDDGRRELSRLSGE